MKSFLQFLTVVLLIMVIMALPASTVHASPQYELIPNPSAEAYLLAELRATGYVDLEWNFPNKEDRVISGTFLETALKDPDVQNQPAIYITNASVAGELWLNDRTISSTLDFREMEFEGFVNFSGSQLQSLVVYNSNFHDSLFFGRSVFNNGVDIRDNIIDQSLNFYGARVSGDLLLDGTRILGTEAMSGATYPSEFWATTVYGTASFNGAYFEGDAYFAKSTFNRLDMWNVTFSRYVSFNETTVERSADFTNATFKGEADFKNFYVGNLGAFTGAAFQADANFESATVLRTADFTDAAFNGKANFDYFTAERFIDFINTTFSQGFSFSYTSVAWPYFVNVTFDGPVNFEGMQTSQDFELVDTRYNYAKEPFYAKGANVEGAVLFTRFTAPAGMVLSHGHFGSLTINTNKDNPDIEFIDLTATEIAGEMVIENVNTKSFLAEGASIDKSTALLHVSITEKLDMRNANIGFLKVDDQPRWPTDPNAFNLRGMTYTDIDLGDKGLTEETWQGLLQLVNQSAYSPQAYLALSQFLTDKGHPDWAAEVDLAQKRRERNEVLAPLSGPWLWSWFLDIFAGYGKRPALAFIWSGFVVAIGAFVFRRKEYMLPTDDLAREYNPIWYSFALFLPYIDLGIASSWEPNPERKWARYYKYVHMLLGWILAPIALLTFGGIIG